MLVGITSVVDLLRDDCKFAKFPLEDRLQEGAAEFLSKLRISE